MNDGIGALWTAIRSCFAPVEQYEKKAQCRPVLFCTVPFLLFSAVFLSALLFHLRSADILHLAPMTFYFRTDRIPHLCSDRSTPHTNPAAEGSDCLRQ